MGSNENNIKIYNLLPFHTTIQLNEETLIIERKRFVSLENGKSCCFRVKIENRLIVPYCSCNSTKCFHNEQHHQNLNNNNNNNNNNDIVIKKEGNRIFLFCWNFKFLNNDLSWSLPFRCNSTFFTSNWMNILINQIGGLKMKDLILMCSHNSFTYDMSDKIFTNRWTSCQRYNVTQQLEHGVRCLDLRIGRKYNNNKNKNNNTH